MADRSQLPSAAQRTRRRTRSPALGAAIGAGAGALIIVLRRLVLGGGLSLPVLFGAMAAGAIGGLLIGLLSAGARDDGEDEVSARGEHPRGPGPADAPVEGALEKDAGRRAPER